MWTHTFDFQVTSRNPSFRALRRSCTWSRRRAVCLNVNLTIRIPLDLVLVLRHGSTERGCPNNTPGAMINQGLGWDSVAQLVVLVVQVEGYLSKSRYFGADSFNCVTPFLLLIDLVYTFWGRELVTKQV